MHGRGTAVGSNRFLVYWKQKRPVGNPRISRVPVHVFYFPERLPDITPRGHSEVEVLADRGEDRAVFIAPFVVMAVAGIGVIFATGLIELAAAVVGQMP
jgi:hypothetical protein